MNKSTRIARSTFDIVFLLLLLLPVLSYLLVLASDGGYTAIGSEIEFDAFVFENYLAAETSNVSDVLRQCASYFGTPAVVYYMTYVVYVCIGWVFVNVLCFIPKLCVKLMKGWL